MDGASAARLESVTDQEWDFVITVCDRAKEAVEKLERLALEKRVRQIGEVGTAPVQADAERP